MQLGNVVMLVRTLQIEGKTGILPIKYIAFSYRPHLYCYPNKIAIV